MGFWNLHCISPLLSLPRTYQLVKAIPIRSVSTTDDSIIWESSPSGDFDPKNAGFFFFKKNNYKTQTILLVRQHLKLIWFLTILLGSKTLGTNVLELHFVLCWQTMIKT